MNVLERTQPGTLRAVRAAIQTLADAGQLHPLVDSQYPLEKARHGLERLESGLAVGKVVVEVADSSARPRRSLG
jgi:NADPH2:quinone reductase